MAIKCTINQSIGEIVWGPFADGSVETLHVGRTHEKIREYAVFHGLKQRGTDVMALKAEDFGGRVPESAKRTELQEMIRYLESGAAEWSRVASAGPREAGLLFAALCNLRSGKTTAQIGKFLESRTPEQLKLVKARQDVIEEMNRLRLERAPKVDTSDSLDDLDSDGASAAEDSEDAEEEVNEVDAEIRELMNK